MPKQRNRATPASPRLGSRTADMEFGLREKRLDSEQGRRDFEAGLYGRHGPDTPEGALWRHVFKLCLEAPEAEPGLSHLRELAAAGPLEPETHRMAALMPPLGHIPPITREVSSQEGYDAGVDALLSLTGSTAAVRAEHTAKLRSALERHGATPGAAQWIQHEVMVILIASFGSPDAPTRASLHTWKCVHDALWREAVESVLSRATA